MLSSKNRIVFFTNDVETTSLRNHCLSDKAGKLVLDEGIPNLLNLYAKYNVKSTFFITGYIAEKFPDIVKLIVNAGHEIASHGYSHDSSQAFDLLSYEEQVKNLIMSKKILEDICGDEVISFRAPALRVNQFTVSALEDSGFKIDSSVASQRLDVFFSFGSMRKLKWISAPRKCYYTSKNELTKRGNSKIFEIPNISYALPYIGTFMRISPSITKLVRSIANIDNIINGNFPVFIIHPNEIIDEDYEEGLFVKRTKNIISYLMADKLRYKLKLRNLGSKAIPLFEDQIKYFKNKGFRFITLKEFFYLNSKTSKGDY